MKTITTIVTQYQAEDGTIFSTKELCATHDQLKALDAVINANWPNGQAIPKAVIATMLIATWDQLCDAMEVHNEDWMSNPLNETEPVEQAAEDEIDPAQYAIAFLYAEKWATEYTMTGVGHRSYDANLKEAFNRKMGELRQQNWAKPVHKIDWYDEYSELSVRVIQGAMASVAYQAAIEHPAGSAAYYELYNIEMARLLDLAAADLAVQERIDYAAQFGGMMSAAHKL